MDKRLQWAIAQIMERITPKFFGTVTITFQSGKLSDLKIEQVHKPKDYGID